MMRGAVRRLVLIGLVAAGASLGGCATVAGTVASPLTGGVDLCVQALRPHQWYLVPFTFIGGTIGGPFVAFYNGINYDATLTTNQNDDYWESFPMIFKPWGMIL